MDKSLSSILKATTDQDLPFAQIALVREITDGNTCTVDPIDSPDFDVNYDIVADRAANGGKATNTSLIYDVKYSPSTTETVTTPSVNSYAFVMYLNEADAIMVGTSGVSALNVGSGDHKVEFNEKGKSTVGHSIDSTSKEETYDTHLSGQKGIKLNVADSEAYWGMTGVNLNSVNFEKVNFRSKCGAVIRINGCNDELIVPPKGKVRIFKSVDRIVNKAISSKSTIGVLDDKGTTPKFKLPITTSNYGYWLNAAALLSKSSTFGVFRESMYSFLDVPMYTITEAELDALLDPIFTEDGFVLTNILEDTIASNDPIYPVIIKVIIEQLSEYTLIEESFRYLYLGTDYKKALLKLQEEVDNSTSYSSLLTKIKDFSVSTKYTALIKKELLEIIDICDKKISQDRFTLTNITSRKNDPESRKINEIIEVLINGYDLSPLKGGLDFIDESEEDTYSTVKVKISLGSILTKIDNLVDSLATATENLITTGATSLPTGGPVTFLGLTTFTADLKVLTKAIKSTQKDVKDLFGEE